MRGSSVFAPARTRQKTPAVKGRRRKTALEMMKTEEFLHYQVCGYLIKLREKHPELEYRTDLSGMRMPISMRLKIWPSKFDNAPEWAKDLQSTSGWPDIQVILPGKGTLYLELKKDGVKLCNRKGTWANAHFAEQASMLDKLRRSGACAVFAVGLDDSVWSIETWLVSPQLLHKNSKHQIGK